jgi:hypothetical protein
MNSLSSALAFSKRRFTWYLYQVIQGNVGVVFASPLQVMYIYKTYNGDALFFFVVEALLHSLPV